MNFDKAFERLIGHEGGYVNDPRDPGGETKFGISKRSYPAEDIKGLTLERAKAIYRRDFWGAAGCDAVPDAMRFDLFDMAVNSGPVTAIKTLQRSAGVTPDGLLGPITLRALSGAPAPRLVARFNGHRLDFMTDLKTWSVFGKGWAKRVASNLKEA
ncbi:MAG: glycosyl hydrolase 108 family protein [Aquabacterium sp.]|jgi:lysozyme family protein|uniref:glycoside hydrolase family 108 protein n=1 Tax=Aquabacterium sp. TaxID=1872578 RepID=UPI002A36D37B|nr:glycosyl hydrolase 108 family protein [Aquabacterium sp.]MDX9843916.1 glycosyl hydrolase 108 family protein [Aquabacterium sp.]